MKPAIPKGENILAAILAILFAASLSVVCLFNYAYYYELAGTARFWLSLAVFIFFALLVFLSIRFFVVPFRQEFANRRNLLFLGFLSLVLLRILFYASSYYWSIPRLADIQICNVSASPDRSLQLLEMHDTRAGRQFLPGTLGYPSYPVTIASGSCIGGRLNGLLQSDQRSGWLGVDLVFKQKAGPQALQVSLNGVQTPVLLENQDGVEGLETVTVIDGLRESILVSNPWGRSWLVLVKWICLALSTVFLSFLLFGISERLISGSERNEVGASVEQMREGDVSRPAGYPAQRVLLVLTLAYFMIFALLMTRIGGQPDQTMHGYYSMRFGETWGIPLEDPQSAYYTTGNEFLYYWLNGAVLKVYRFLAPGDALSGGNQGYILRLFSVLLSTVTVFYVYKLASVVTANKYAGVLAAFFMSNTLMFVFVSGGITYDNLMNLGSIAAIYHLVRVYRGEDYVRNTALTGIWLCIGSLAKVELLLATLLVFLAWLNYTYRWRRQLSLNFGGANKIWISVFVLTLAVFTIFYGSNLVRYHRPVPQCAQVKPKEVCTRFQERQQYYHPVDLRQIWEDRNRIFDYAFGWWPRTMVGTIWGILSSKTYAPGWVVSLHTQLILWGIVCMLLYLRRRDALPALLLAILAGFMAYVFYWNLKGELHSDFMHFAVQGRYLFPVLPVLLTLMITFFLRIRPLFLRRLTLSLSVVLYFAAGLGLFVFKYPEVFIFWRLKSGG